MYNKNFPVEGFAKRLIERVSRLMTIPEASGKLPEASEARGFREQAPSLRDAPSRCQQLFSTSMAPKLPYVTK